MKRILKALAKTLGFLTFGVLCGITPVVLDKWFGPVAAITVIAVVLVSVLFTLIYKMEK